MSMYSSEIMAKDITNKLTVTEGKKINLQKLSPDYDFSINEKKAEYVLKQNLKKRMSDLQYRLYAERKKALLIVFQGIDTSGKDIEEDMLSVHSTHKLYS